MLVSASLFATENILDAWLIKYLVEHLFIQIDVRYFVSKESMQECIDTYVHESFV